MSVYECNLVVILITNADGWWLVAAVGVGGYGGRDEEEEEEDEEIPGGELTHDRRSRAFGLDSNSRIYQES